MVWKLLCRLLPVTPLLLAGCDGLFGGGNSSITGETACLERYGNINNGALPDGCIKTEGGDHGKLETLTVGGSSIEFTSWLSKNESGEGEYVGFTYVAPEGTFISIKAGGESYLEVDGDGVWVNPNGTSGDKASAISNIVICEGAPDENGPGGDGGGCNDSDGDGIPDNEDGDFPGLGDLDPMDGDGDGVPDLLDGDDDNDGIPDARDADRNGDGVPDDVDGDGNPDLTDGDIDGDGIPNADDATPNGELDPIDGDGDGTPDHADADDDGDGIPDAQDPSPNGEPDPIDSDGDGNPDATDGDDDNDGVPDAQDPSPTGGPDPVSGGQCLTNADCGGAGYCNNGVCIDV